MSELHAQIPTVLYNFGANPGDPVIPGFSGLVQGRDGNMYATTEGGGIMDYGTVIKLTPSGTLAVLYKFDNTHGIYPNGISLGTDGNFYGATNGGGTMGKGTIYQIAPSGALTTLYSFTGGSDGGFPAAGPILAVNGNLYGPSGPLYQLTLGGQFTTIYSGTSTPLAPFLQAGDGHFYGTDYVAGANGAGQVFKVSVSGVYTILHGFMETDGENPQAALIQGNDGKFYGSTYNLAHGGKGTIFSITSSGNFKLLHRFGGPEGAQPVAALLQGPDGNFYGGTYSGGTANGGTFFQLNLVTRKLSVLFNFDSTSGTAIETPLVQHTNGKLYGLAAFGGTYGKGTFFTIDLGFSPFAGLVRSFGRVGTTVDVLGQGFTGSTNVTFNGVSATFTVVSDTYLTATVPTGATTGFVTVTTPTGTLNSNKKFQVTP